MTPLTSIGGHLLFTTETGLEDLVEGALAGNEGIPKDVIKPPVLPSAEVGKVELAEKVVFRRPKGFVDKPLSPNKLVDGWLAAAAADGAGRKEKGVSSLASKSLFSGCPKGVD